MFLKKTRHHPQPNAAAVVVAGIGFSCVLLIIVIMIPSTSSEDGGFRSVALRYHNYYRRQNSAQPLELDQELNKMAHGHAEKLAVWNNLTASDYGYRENLWSYRGELLPLAKDCEYAIKNWYTGSKAPGNVQSSVDAFVLRSDSVHFVGFGVGTSENNGDSFTAVVALYSS